MMGGNLNNYDTFENLSSGLRLFDYSVDMRSINHQGLFFDNLSFSNFGYGGDPDDVSRLRVDRNKWYDFRGMFRRDKNFWNYNLLANPLNPVGAIVPNPAIASSPHALDLSRRMQGYDLTLLPESRLRSVARVCAQRQYGTRAQHTRGRHRAVAHGEPERHYQFLSHGGGLPRS